MTNCSHDLIVLLPSPPTKLRCRHCHLTLSADELGEGSCPECLEEKGLRHRDFEELKRESVPEVQYRCERCGLLIEA